MTGLTLGGGIGPNAPWAGLTADRLRAATMVTADGDVVTASTAEDRTCSGVCAVARAATSGW